MNFIKKLLKQKHVNWALADQATVSAVNFLTGVLLARYLGIVEFGIFTLAWLVVEFMHNVQFSLIIGPMVSILPKYSLDQRPQYVAAVILQQAAFAVLAFALFWTVLRIGEILYPSSEFALLTLSLSVVVFASQLQNFVRRYLFTVGGVIAAFLIDIVRYVGQIALLFWLLTTTTMDTAQVLWVISATSVASVVLGLFFVETLSWHPDSFRETLVRHWRFGSWMLLSEIMRWISGNFYAIVAGTIIGPAAVGAIRATQNLVAMCNILLLGLENVIPVSASRRLRSGGTDAMFAYLGKVGWAGGTAVGAVLLVVAVAPDFWLDLVYDGQYSEYGYLVWWWCLVYVITFINTLGKFGLRTLEKTKAFFWAFLASTLFTLAMVYPMINHFGVAGVMVGYLCVGLIQLSVLYHWLLVRKPVHG